MNDFTYSAVRSFNQYLNTNFSCGTDEQLVLNAHPSQVKLDRDTVSVHFYDETVREIGGGRQVSGSRARFGELWCQVDVWSPPNTSGEPRNGANRKLKDKVEQVFKAHPRIDLLAWDGTGGTQSVGGMYVRETGARWVPDEEMEGWSRWSLDYHLRAVDSD